ncbi:TadE family protein [Propioniciclava tarda]|uniref:Pilus assembly protein n=1 Tax=Propioniciclava tarda TaxID=433330 RepID=A0A4V2JTI4_PROTD|nr:TadE family protein [Propioniciclava tarda]TBT96121.1 pilus assembly protein [Propioniciclava tarda]SMO31978.1 TadE-like protein [Propioniciclava tarda]HOA89095.1 pilus assembly protein [Propioniciclava tarda]HQA31191.1 pilus assembly protein [Propioniciclava tarda]HQD60769.1 pilus assembly protein [Propioniciclava tarda]
MRNQRGLSESVQWVMITPVLMLVVLGIIQLGLWGYGRTVVANAAGAAAEEAAPLGATLAQGTAVGRSLATRGGLSDIAVSVTYSGDDVVARVSGRMPGLVDLAAPSLVAQVTRTRESVTQP